MSLESPINGRPVLQPVPPHENKKLITSKKTLTKPPCTPPPPPPMTRLTVPSKNATPRSSFYKPTKPSPAPISPKFRSAAATAILKRATNDAVSLNMSMDKQCTITTSINSENFTGKPTSSPSSSSSPRGGLIRGRKKSRKSSSGVVVISPDHHGNSAAQLDTSLLLQFPGSIPAARREQVKSLHEIRKQKIAHYGRKATKTRGGGGGGVLVEEPPSPTNFSLDQRKCNFISIYSDPIYVMYHDEEWGVPVHDDKMLCELLVLAAAQVGSDWTSILKKRDDFRDAFDGFDAKHVANYSEKKIISISNKLGVDISLVRATIDNANILIQIQREYGSFDNYIWGFVNYKPINPEYRLCRKIPVKTSKSESISKAMVRKKFRFVGPTVIHSFMQAAGLTNDHLTSCTRHSLCMSIAAAEVEASL